MSNEPAAAPAKDDATVIREALEAAVRLNLTPAATEHAYPGHFTIVADGHWFGKENTWPGLVSWQERYHPLQVARVDATGPKGYCEYAAIFTRLVLGHPEIFGKVELPTK